MSPVYILNQLESLPEYLEGRKTIYTDKEKDICLMDMATLAMKELKSQGKLDDLKNQRKLIVVFGSKLIEVDEEDWLVMFKNETHNHPTEIELGAPLHV